MLHSSTQYSDAGKGRKEGGEEGRRERRRKRKTGK